MYYGIQLAASGALTALYRTDVLANNLANLNTAGFKPDIPHARQRDVARAEDGLWDIPSNEMLERLGAGVHMAPNAVDHRQGPLSRTDNPLDLALDGDGFFVVRALADGDTSQIQFTRDGRFTLDASGRLVTVTSGLPVLDRSNRPITLDKALAVSVDADGTVRQAGQPVARLGVMDLEDRSLLRRQGDGRFALTDDALDAARPARAGVRQGMVEFAAVNAVSAMMSVQTAARSVNTNYSMVAYQDRMMDQAINTFARIG